MNEKATLILHRRMHLLGCLRKFTLFVDGQQAGTVANGKEEQVQVSIGHHTIYVRGAGFSKTGAIELDLLDGDIKKFECGVSVKLTWLVVISTLIILGLVWFVYDVNFASFSVRLGLAILYCLITLYLNYRRGYFKRTDLYYLLENKP